MSTPEYEKWKVEPTPDNMAQVVQAMDTTINSEIQRYSGSKPLLRSRAKELAINAVKTYDPTSGAHLRSWVVTQLKPLSRYTQQLRPVHASEVAMRQAAELNRIHTELADELGHVPTVGELADHTGLSPARINKIRVKVPASMSESQIAVDDEGFANMPGVTGSDVVGMADEIVYDSLSPRDKMIYDLKTGKHGKQSIPNQEIAKRLGVTPAMISQRSQQIALQIKDLSLKRGA